MYKSLWERACSSHGQQCGGALQTRVSADMHGLWGGELHVGGAGLLVGGVGCSSGQNVHGPQQNCLTAPVTHTYTHTHTTSFENHTHTQDNEAKHTENL